jgi:hypothetical protein
MNASFIDPGNFFKAVVFAETGEIDSQEPCIPSAPGSLDFHRAAAPGFKPALYFVMIRRYSAFRHGNLLSFVNSIDSFALNSITGIRIFVFEKSYFAAPTRPGPPWKKLRN